MLNQKLMLLRKCVLLVGLTVIAAFATALNGKVAFAGSGCCCGECSYRQYPQAISFICSGYYCTAYRSGGPITICVITSFTDPCECLGSSIPLAKDGELVHLVEWNSSTTWSFSSQACENCFANNSYPAGNDWFFYGQKCSEGY